MTAAANDLPTCYQQLFSHLVEDESIYIYGMLMIVPKSINNRYEGKNKKTNWYPDLYQNLTEHTSYHILHYFVKIK